MDTRIRIADVLKLGGRMVGLGAGLNVKLVRHQDSRYDVSKLIRCGKFELYQSLQSEAIFSGCDLIVSFTGLERCRALLHGVYRVQGEPSRANGNETDGYADCRSKPVHAEPDDVVYRYALEKQAGFDDLEGRVVIAWGSNTRAWHQWLCRKTQGIVEGGNKEVVEILPAGYVMEFPGYLDVCLNRDELVKVVKETDGTRKWRTLLSGVAGVYLITDTVSGLQYVGSAYGKDGILGRWTAYASDPTGGNVALKHLLDADPRRVEYLQYSILETLDKSLPDREVIHHEWKYKRKLGPRAVALDAEPEDPTP